MSILDIFRRWFAKSKPVDIPVLVPASNHNRARLIAMVKRHEGLRLEPYQDTTGAWTIGYGHNLDAHGESIPHWITNDQAEVYLKKDLESAIRNCELFVPRFDKLDEVRQAVLIDMCFNLGINGLLTFKRTLHYIEFGYYAEAADEMLVSRWASQVHGRAIELSEMMRTGEWQE